jgi:hypothetical protein
MRATRDAAGAELARGTSSAPATAATNARRPTARSELGIIGLAVAPVVE